MPVVEVNERLQAPAVRVWELVRDVEAYPRLMEPVRSLRVLDEGPNWVVTAWEVVLKGSILQWVEHEERDDERYRLTYRQIEGDLQEFDGYWQVTALAPGVAEAALMVRFEIGIPMLRDMLDPVAERAIRENCRLMLRSLGPSSAPSARDRGLGSERAF
jgi:coenzyme Q-binding protein COQ10